MTGNYKEKYLRLNLDLAPMAGKLDQSITTQKRLIERIARRRDITDDVKELLVSVAESIEVSEELLKFTKKFMHGVVEDSNALLEGAELRNKILWHSQLLEDKLK